ncbi:SsrA-binding protein SmpB [Alkalicoccobacillus murimartini]|uniref:SsrA-binding protein n=1 Tax=Alkalicoccobacillus murimartini TaxID=171685 RepID=A0ABT9YFS6_9BACI|nr:SsrA-binding protein SmpB [Alkalicoccobacillus murimartini]MDQ0206675.1 SsrA-binding protein [Alkalicoccobacillus murimartini]
MAKPKADDNLVAQNKKARHDYFVEETFEAGMVLQGTEIKSMRAGRMNLKESFARIRDGEVYLHNAHIAEYEQGNRFNHEPTRARKLLLKKKEISQLIGQTQQQGYSLVPLKVYIKNGFAKVLLGVAKGKKNYDKRETLRRQDAKREVDRAMKERFNG